MVYIREAHPDSILYVPTSDGGKSLAVVPQGENTAARLKNLVQCTSLLQLTMPAVLDSDDNVVNRAYAAWPDRLYGIGLDGRVTFKTGPGPQGFRVADLAEWLNQTIK